MYSQNQIEIAFYTFCKFIMVFSSGLCWEPIDGLLTRIMRNTLFWKCVLWPQSLFLFLSVLGCEHLFFFCLCIRLMLAQPQMLICVLIIMMLTQICVLQLLKCLVHSWGFNIFFGLLTNNVWGLCVLCFN